MVNKPPLSPLRGDQICAGDFFLPIFLEQQQTLVLIFLGKEISPPPPNKKPDTPSSVEGTLAPQVYLSNV